MKSKEKSEETSMEKLTKKHVYPKDYYKLKGKHLVKKIRMLKASLGPRYASKTFKNFDKQRCPAAYNLCLDYVRNFIENLQNGTGLFITGSVGSGKTHLAAAVIDYVARLYKRKINSPIIFTSAVEMLSEIKYSFDRKHSDDETTEELMERFENCSLLVIDDLGTEKATDWSGELFYKIIDYRYCNLKPVIITTNLTDQEIKERLSQRLLSRIYEMCKGIKITANDYRLGN